jgi:hypothetical protein
MTATRRPYNASMHVGPHKIRHFSRRSWIVVAIVAAVPMATVLSGAQLVFGTNASAASPPVCTSTPPYSCTYSYTGTEQSYHVPAGAIDVAITAVGAPGGTVNTSTGGRGAVVTAIVPVPPTATRLYVEVGQSGALVPALGSAFNGGGSANGSGAGAVPRTSGPRRS